MHHKLCHLHAKQQWTISILLPVGHFSSVMKIFNLCSLSFVERLKKKKKPELVWLNEFNWMKIMNEREKEKQIRKIVWIFIEFFSFCILFHSCLCLAEKWENIFHVNLFLSLLNFGPCGHHLILPMLQPLHISGTWTPTWHFFRICSPFSLQSCSNQ